VKGDLSAGYGLDSGNTCLVEFDGCVLTPLLPIVSDNLLVDCFAYRSESLIRSLRSGPVAERVADHEQQLCRQTIECSRHCSTGVSVSTTTLSALVSKLILGITTVLLAAVERRHIA
jgi:hypothetical protein